MDPFDVALECRKKLVDAVKGVTGHFGPEMSVIALARLVVISQYADAVDHRRQPVLGAVCRAWKWRRKLPKDKFCKGYFAE